MAPARGFEPTIASNQPSFEPAHVVKRHGEKELRPGAGAVSCEETTGSPKPRTPLPRPLSHYATERGVPLQDQHVTDMNGYRTMHHPQCACVIWDCGNGVLESVPYHEAHVWVQQDKGRPVFTSGRWMEAETSARRLSGIVCRTSHSNPEEDA